MALEIKPGQVLFHAGGASLARYGVLARRLVPGTGVRESFTRASPAWQRTRSGRLVQAATDVLRASYNEHGEWVIPLELARTNFLLNTATEGTLGAQPTSRAAGAPNTIVVSQDITDIDGNGFVNKHTRNAASGPETNVGHQSHAGTVLANTAYTGSMWLYLPSAANISSIRASLEGTAIPSGAQGAVADLSKVGQFQRLTVTGTTDADGGALSLVLRVVATGSVDGIVAYSDDWQLEEGSFATTWQKTLGSLVARAQDSLSWTLPFLRGTRAFSVYTRFRKQFTDTGGLLSPRIWQIGGESDVDPRLVAFFVSNTSNISVAHDTGTPINTAPFTLSTVAGDDVEVLVTFGTDGAGRITARKNGGAPVGADLAALTRLEWSAPIFWLNRASAGEYRDVKIIAGALSGGDTELLDACARAAA